MTKPKSAAKKKAATKKSGASRSAKKSATKSASAETTPFEQQEAADRAAAGSTGNEAQIRRDRNTELAAEAERKMSGAEVGEGGPRSTSYAHSFRSEFPGQELGTEGARSGGDSKAATPDLAKRQQVVAERTAGASHGALHVQADPAAGFTDPSPEGARPKGGGSPVLGEHVVGDTEFRGSRGLADRTQGAGTGPKAGAAPKASEMPRGFKPGKSAASEQRDSNYDGNRAASAAPPLAGQRQAKKGSIKLLFVCTDRRELGPADVPANASVAILKAAPPGLAEQNTEFFAVQPSGTLALNGFKQEHADLLVLGETYEVTITPKTTGK